MIKYIDSHSRHLQVTCGGAPYINNNYAVGVGQVRFNASTQQLEIYDGYSWVTYSATASVNMNETAASAIDWAIKKMADEQNLEALMDKHPGLREAYEKFQVMRILVQEEHNGTKS